MLHPCKYYIGSNLLPNKVDLQSTSAYLHFSVVHESVRWLAERGEAKKCVEILKKIARTNGKEVKEEIYDSYEVQIFWAESKTFSYTSYSDSITETCVQTI